MWALQSGDVDKKPATWTGRPQKLHPESLRSTVALTMFIVWPLSPVRALWVEL